MKRLLLGLAACLAALVLIGAAGLGVLQTHWGVNKLAGALSRVLSSPTQRVSILGLRGRLPFDIRIVEIMVLDRAGPSLVIQDVSASLSAADLLKGRLTFTHLDIARIANRGTGQAQPESPSGGGDLGALLNPPFPIAIRSLDIDQIAIATPTLEMPLILSLRGSVAVGGGRAQADLVLRQFDGDGAADLHLSYADARLGIDATVSEPRGTVLAGLLQRPAPLPFSLAVKGAGPLDDWQGTASFAAGNEASASLRVRVAGDEPRRIALDGTANVAALLPPDVQPLAQGTVTIAAAASVGAKSLALDRLELSGPARLSAQGSYARDGGALSGHATLALADLAPLSAIAGTPLEGSATLDLTVGGTLAAPAATVTVDAAKLGLPQGHIDTAHASFEAKGAPQGPIALSGSGTFSGIAPLPEGLGPQLDWSLAGRLDPSSGTLALDRFALSDAGATLTGAAALSRDGATGTLQLALADLRPFDGGALGGRLEAAADLHLAADGTGTAVISGALASPSDTARIEALLGPSITFAGTVERRSDGSLAAREVTLDAAAAKLAGSAERRADGKIAADFSGTLPRLALLDPNLAGAAAAHAKIEGPADALHATLTLDAPAIVAYGRRIEALGVTLDLPSVALARGTLVTHLRIAGLALEASAAGSLAGDTLTLSRINASAAGARVDGALTLKGLAVEGTLAGRIPDLAPFSALAGTALAGRATFEVRAQGQHYALTLDGTGLGAAGTHAERIRLAASIADPFHPTGTATLDVTNAASGAAHLESATIAARSERPGRFALTVSAKGRVVQPFAVALGASVGWTKGALDLSLARLDGTVGALPLKLARPLEASWRDGSGRVEGLALEIGAGTLTGEGSLGAGGSVSLHLLARGLPVHALAGLADKEAEGTLGFEASVAGTRRAPEARLIVDGEGLRFAPATGGNLPALGLVLNADWRNGQVTLAGRLAGPRGAAIGWHGSMPLVASETWVPALPRQGAVQFRLEGDGDLGAFSDLMPEGEGRLAGRFAVDVSIDGTVADPDAKGRLAVSDARYENFATGATLAGLRFALVGARDRLVLQDFAANDGGKGVLRLQGSVDLAASPIPEFELSGNLDHFRALRRDEGSATASGSFKFAGSIAAPRLEASLTIDEADIAVPERLSPSLTPVKAVKIDSATGANLTPAAAPEAQPSPLETLALDVHVSLPGKTFVRGRGLDSEWRGAVAVKGTTHEPLLTGQLNAVRGTFDFIGVTFVLQKGVVTFLGGTSIDPTISLESTAQSSNITAIVDITGTATQPTIKLSSAPALPRDEILSRLLFGTSMSQVSPAEGLQLASAAASLAGGQSLDVLGKIRRGLGLDRLSLGAAPGSVVPGVGVPSLQGTPGQPGTGPATGVGTTPLAPGSPAAGGAAAGTALSAGRYVASGVYVGVSQGLGTGSSTVRVQVDVTRHITVNTEAGEASGAGVGVTWKLDY